MSTKPAGAAWLQAKYKLDRHILTHSYSKSLMHFIRYDKKTNGALVITNPAETEGYFRYPGLTELAFICQKPYRQPFRRIGWKNSHSYDVS